MIKVGQMSSERSTLEAENFGRTRNDNLLSFVQGENFPYTGAHGAITAFEGFFRSAIECKTKWCHYIKKKGCDNMAFSQMLEILKKKEKGTIVFVKLGTFYVEVGEDAVLIHKKLDLKCTCFKMNICKVGFPVVAFDKYVEKLNQTKYAYVIYDFDAEKAELKEIVRRKGKYNKEVEKSINCLLCSGDVNKRYAKPDKYALALTKMLEEERKENRKI